MSVVTLRVNGATHEVDIDESMPLLYLLRNDLGLQGPRFGCGLAQCGACTVIVDGVAIRSCVMPASQVRGEITTLEGLSNDGQLDPLQRAWICSNSAGSMLSCRGMMSTSLPSRTYFPNSARTRADLGV